MILCIMSLSIMTLNIDSAWHRTSFFSSWTKIFSQDFFCDGVDISCQHFQKKESCPFHPQPQGQAMTSWSQNGLFFTAVILHSVNGHNEMFMISEIRLGTIVWHINLWSVSSLSPNGLFLQPSSYIQSMIKMRCSW